MYKAVKNGGRGPNNWKDFFWFMGINSVAGALIIGLVLLAN